MAGEGQGHEMFVTDVSQKGAVNDLMKQVKVKFEGQVLRAVVCCAGIITKATIVDTQESDLDKVLGVNLKV